MDDSAEYECPECGEPVDEDGYTLILNEWGYGLVMCELCGDHNCDQSC